MLKSKNILFLISGSIAIPKAVDLLKMFVKSKYTIRVACTESTFNFISKNELENITGFPVIHKNFQNKLDMEHINLGRWADLCILCPATANTINHLAYGSGDNIIGTLFLAYELGKKPFLVAPAMNTQMYNNPATICSINKLKNWGLDVLPTNYGELACGEIGEGRLLEADFIYNYINNKYFNNKTPKKILITSGATRESIDGVRFITNFSTGKTGAKVADQLTLLGSDVTLLKAKNAYAPKYCNTILTFDDFNDLNNKVKNELSNNHFDAIIMTAAISDYSIDSISVNNINHSPNLNLKINSDDSLSINLKKNFKIINKINHYSTNKNISIIAFKLTKSKNTEDYQKAVDKVLVNKDIHIVIHNNLIEIEKGQHNFNIYKRGSEPDTNLNLYSMIDTIDQHINSNPRLNKENTI